MLLGDNFSLVCGRGLDSNPQATITWTAPDGAIIVDNARYVLENGPDIVRLNFTQTILSDSGIWTCDVIVRSERHIVSSEGELIRGGQITIGTPVRYQFMVTVIGESLIVTVNDLFVIIHAILNPCTVPPGQPHQLSVKNIGAAWVRISWQPPLEVNFPITRYEVIARDVGGVHLLNTSKLDNSTIIRVAGLLRGTTYNFSVVAVSQAGEVVARSAESVPLGNITTATKGICM